MPHADSSILPDSVQSKKQLWSHIYTQLEGLLEGQSNWISNCANASSLVYHTLMEFPSHFGTGDRAVNWCGFYIDSKLYPSTRISRRSKTEVVNEGDSKLLLGPFCGKPACQFINTTAGKARGVCADAFLLGTTVLVSDVEAYPGHIDCDDETKSELVSPLILNGQVIGVLDLDCLALSGFDEEDRQGVEKIAKLVVDCSDW